MKNNLFPIAIFLFLLGACTQKPSEEKPCIVIDLAENIGKTANETTLNDIFELKKAIPLETSDSFLLSQRVYFVDVNDNEFILSDRKAVYYVDHVSGKLRSILNEKGEGPGKYIEMSSILLDNQSNLLIADENKQMLLKYSPNGDYIGNILNDSIGETQMLNNDFYAVNHRPQSSTKHLMSIYDKSWNLVRQSFPRDKENVVKSGMIFYDSFRKLNGESYFKHAFGDTIYHVTPLIDKPYIVIDKGSYKMPRELTGDFAKMKKESSNYIRNDLVWMIDNYMFIRYYYGDAIYSDIWNIEKEQLIHRNLIRRDEPGGTNGFPFVVDGVQVTVLPSYVSGDYLYCVVSAHEAMGFMPSVQEEDNPVILALKLKTE